MALGLTPAEASFCSSFTSPRLETCRDGADVSQASSEHTEGDESLSSSATIPDPLFSRPEYQFVKRKSDNSYGFSSVYKRVHDQVNVDIQFVIRGGAVLFGYIQRGVLDHRRLYHPHVIQLKEVILTDAHLCIVMEHVSGCDLATYLRLRGSVGRTRGLAEPVARSFFQQIIIAVDHCHRKGVADRDLRLENVMLEPVPGTNLQIAKLMDFGLSKAFCLKKGNHVDLGGERLSPESIMNRTYDGQKADIWSCGIMLYRLLVGAYPTASIVSSTVAGQQSRALLNAVLNFQLVIPDDVLRTEDGVELSKDCIDLLSLMLTMDPNQRITIEQILDHPWFNCNLPEGDRATTEQYLNAASTAGRQSEEDIRSMLTEAGHRSWSPLSL